MHVLLFPEGNCDNVYYCGKVVDKCLRFLQSFCNVRFFFCYCSLLILFKIERKLLCSLQLKRKLKFYRELIKELLGHIYFERLRKLHCWNGPSK